MSSCIPLFYIALFLLPGSSARASAGPSPPQTVTAAPAADSDPDALYRQRTDIAKARAAADLWSARLARGGDFESAWKLARVSYWLGGRGSTPERRAALERGVEAGRQAAQLQPQRPDGYFWMAASMGALAESFGLRQGLKYRGAVKEALEKVLTLDPTYQGGSADRALGRWYFKVPGLFGGDKKKSEQHLRRSLTLDPDSTVSHLFLADTLFDLGRKAEAIQELRTVLAVPINPDWEAEDREFKEQARRRLGELK